MENDEKKPRCPEDFVYLVEQGQIWPQTNDPARVKLTNGDIMPEQKKKSFSLTLCLCMKNINESSYNGFTKAYTAYTVFDY